MPLDEMLAQVRGVKVFVAVALHSFSLLFFFKNLSNGPAKKQAAQRQKYLEAAKY